MLSKIWWTKWNVQPLPCISHGHLHQTHMLHGSPLQWRHNDYDGVSNHQPHGCFLKHLFRRRSNKTSKLRVTGLCAGNSPVTGEFPAQRASNAENVSIWWRHHAQTENSHLGMADHTDGPLRTYSLRCHRHNTTWQRLALRQKCPRRIWKRFMDMKHTDVRSGHAALLRSYRNVNEIMEQNYMKINFQNFQKPRIASLEYFIIGNLFVYSMACLG